MKLKTTIVAVFAIFAIACVVPAFAGVSASFNQTMSGYGFVPGASQASYNSLTVGSLGFSGTQSAGMFVINGYADTGNSSAISADNTVLVVTSGAGADVGTWCGGISGAGAGTETNTWAPGLCVGTSNNVSAMTSGNGTANAGSSSIVVVY
jgi:hypothetical protein